MSYSPTTIDLSQLPPPELVDVLSYEAIFEAMVASFQARWAAVRIKFPELPDYDVTMLESDVVVILLQVAAERELLLRGLVNDKAVGNLLAFATGATLEHMGAAFGVAKAAGESEASFKERIQLAPEAFSTAGAQGAYIFHARTVDPVAIPNAWAYSPSPGRVNVVLAGPNGTDVPDSIVAKVIDVFAREDVTPLTDAVAVVRAEVIRYRATGTLRVPRGPDPALLEDQANKAALAYGASRYRIGAGHYRAGFTAGAKVGGVENVTLLTPPADLILTDRQIALCTGADFRAQVIL